MPNSSAISCTLPEEHIADFTVERYRALLRLAKERYRFLRYSEIPADGRFLLWRHDCDFSLNRACALALIEQAEQVASTYFVNPHSEFYNLLEKSQALLVRRIIGAGHDLALHFDAAFHDVETEGQLDELVEGEARLLQQTLGVMPTAFSFHNPTALMLTFENERYGGLTNCYASRFKTEISYCSDSNGYWRYQRLHDVLESASAEKLQVLTHPGWWQEDILYPRERVFRCVYGRAAAVMGFYDDAVESFGRINLVGPAGSLQFLAAADPASFQLCDYLWNRRHFATLFLELWRLLHRQLQASAGVKKYEFSAVAKDTSAQSHDFWHACHTKLISGQDAGNEAVLQQGCIYLCDEIRMLVNPKRETPGFARPRAIFMSLLSSTWSRIRIALASRFVGRANSEAIEKAGRSGEHVRRRSANSNRATAGSRSRP